MNKVEVIQCSFCGRKREEVKILIAGQEGHICEHCIEHAHEIIMKEFLDGILARVHRIISNFVLR